MSERQTKQKSSSSRKHLDGTRRQSGAVQYLPHLRKGAGAASTQPGQSEASVERLACPPPSPGIDCEQERAKVR